MTVRVSHKLFSLPAATALVGVMLVAGTASAQAPQTEEICARAINAAEAKYGVPPKLLLSMNEVETMWDNQAWPWSLNISGTPRRYRDQQSLVAALGEISGRTGNIDIGCMQINWHWVGKECTRTIERLVDPGINALCAARYFRRLYDRLGSWHAAVKAYHVGPGRKEKAARDRAERYVCKVGRNYARFLGKPDPCE